MDISPSARFAGRLSLERRVTQRIGQSTQGGQFVLKRRAVSQHT